MKKIVLLFIFVFCFIFSKSQDFEWAKHFGKKQGFLNEDIVSDRFGNIYVSSWFEDSCDLDPGPAIAIAHSLGGEDAYISKFDPLGNLLWTKIIGDVGPQYIRAMAIDSACNLYYGCYFIGTIDADPSVGVTTYSSAGPFSEDIFFSKLDANGNFVWAKHLGGTANDYLFGLSLIPSTGNIVICGSFSSSSLDFDPGSGTFTMSPSTSLELDAFVAEYDSVGNFVWAKKIGGDDNQEVMCVETDKTGNVYFTGRFQLTADFDPSIGVYNLSSAGNHDIFTEKLDPAGNFLWAKRAGSALYDQPYALCIDSAGNVYTAGEFQSTVDFNPSTASFSITSYGLRDGFVQKLSNIGNFIWAKRIGGPLDDCITDIATDSSSAIFITGHFKNTCDLDPGPGIASFTSSYDNNVHISKWDMAGNYIWGQQIKSIGIGASYAWAILLDEQKNIYTYGYFSKLNDFDPSLATYYMSSTYIYSGGGVNSFLLKLSDSTCIDTADITTSLIGNNIVVNQAGANYQWLDCDQGYEPIFGETQQSFLPPSDGNYAVLVTNGCYSNTSLCVEILTTTINEFNNNSFSIYPNPANNSITIETNEAFELKIINLLGEVVIEQKIKNKETIDISQLNQGVYFIQSNKGQSIKFIKL